MVTETISVINQSLSSYQSLSGNIKLQFIPPLTQAILGGSITIGNICNGGCFGTIDILINGAKVWTQPIDIPQVYNVSQDVTGLVVSGVNTVDVVVTTFGLFQNVTFTVNLGLQVTGDITSSSTTTSVETLATITGLGLLLGGLLTAGYLYTLK